MRKQKFTSASCRTPLVQLVVTYPSALASSSRRASTWHLSLHHLSCLHHSSCPSCLVACHIAQRLNPHLVATPPGASASASCCSLACDTVQRRLPPLLSPYPSRTMSPSPEREWGLPKHHRFSCPRGAHTLPAQDLLCCCHLCTRLFEANLKPNDFPICDCRVEKGCTRCAQGVGCGIEI